MKTELAFVSILAIALSGCGGGGKSHQLTEKYFLVCTNTKIPYWQEAGAGLVRAAEELGVRAELVGPETYDPNAEREEFRRAVSKKPAGILVSPGDPQMMKGEIDAAVAAGIPVVTIDSDAPHSRRLFFVGTNNYQAGLTGGRLLAKLLNGKGNVVIFTIASQANVQERRQGYEAALESAPGIKIVEVVDMKGDARVAFDKTQEIIDQKRPVDAFVALEALSGSEVAEVLDRKKVEGKVVVAMDTTGNTLSWIEKGRIAATIGQKPYTMAYYGLKTLADIALEKQATLLGDFTKDVRAPLPVFIDTGTMLIDKSNAGELKTGGK